MALTDENSGNSMVMPVSPMYGGGNGGFGDFGGSGWWILLLFILLGGNGWGNGFGGNAVADMYPWFNQSNQISNGFQSQMLNDSINGIRDGLQGITAQLNANQIAGMNQNFGLQTAMMQGFNGVQSQFADCCCENRLGIADLKYTVATENCADRAALSDGIRDVMENCNRNNQAILDKLCQLEIDGKNTRIAELERQLSMASLQASQVAQTSQLIADNTMQTQYIVNRVAPYPIPAYTVANPVTPATT